MMNSHWLRRAAPFAAILAASQARADIPPTQGVVESPIGIVVVVAAVAVVGLFLFRRMRRK